MEPAAARGKPAAPPSAPKRRRCGFKGCKLLVLLFVHYVQLGGLGLMLYFEPLVARVDLLAPGFEFQVSRCTHATLHHATPCRVD